MPCFRFICLFKIVALFYLMSGCIWNAMCMLSLTRNIVQGPSSSDVNFLKHSKALRSTLLVTHQPQHCGIMWKRRFYYKNKVSTTKMGSPLQKRGRPARGWRSRRPTHFSDERPRFRMRDRVFGWVRAAREAALGGGGGIISTTWCPENNLQK